MTEIAPRRSPSMVPLKSRLARLLLVGGLVLMSLLLNFTSFLVVGGVAKTAETWWRFWNYNPSKQFDYLFWLILPPLIAAFVAPLLVRWIKSGS